MAGKKQASAQAKGRAAKSIRDSDAANQKIQRALFLTSFRGGDGAVGTKPAQYGNPIRKQSKLAQAQSAEYAQRGDPSKMKKKKPK